LTQPIDWLTSPCRKSVSAFDHPMERRNRGQSSFSLSEPLRRRQFPSAPVGIYDSENVENMQYCVLAFDIDYNRAPR